MADRADFDDYVTARSPRLLKVAYLLTRDHALAEDLLQTSLARAWRAWRRIEGDPEPYVRRILVNTYNTWWRRRWMTEQPTDSPPDTPIPATANDDRDEVLRALGRLPRQQRTVMVLRYYEDMSEAQIAQTMSISEGSVKGYASKALAKLRIDPTLAALATPVETPAGTERLAGVQARIKHHRRQLITIGAACIVVLAIIFGYAIAPDFKSRTLPPMQPSPSPFYRGGNRVVAQKAPVQFGVEDTSLTWTPSTLDAYVYFDCTHDGKDIMVTVQVTINGMEVAQFGCGQPGNGQGRLVGTPLDENLLRTLGITPGTPAILNVKLGKQDNVEVGQVPSNLMIGYAIGESVPFNEYLFPARPPGLGPIFTDTDDGMQPKAVLSKNGDHSARFGWSDTYVLYINTHSPGIITVKINGVAVHQATRWDYEHDRFQIPANVLTNKFKVGEPVTVTVESEHMEDWFVAFAVWVK